MPDRLPEQLRNVEGSGASLPPPTGRGSERFWRRLNIACGTLILSGIIGYALGYVIRPILGVPTQAHFFYQLVAIGMGMFLGLYAVVELSRSGKIKL